MEDWLKKVMAALESGMEINITIRKSEAQKPARAVVTCEHCGWKKDYSRADNADEGLKRHYRNCTKRKEVLNHPLWLVEQTNGTPRGDFRVHCDVCKFEGWYPSMKSAQNAKTTTIRHCADFKCPKHISANSVHLHWIIEECEGEKK